MKSPVVKVRKQVGLNPVAQAVARQRLRASILDMKIAVYMLGRGEKCANLLAGAQSVMQIVVHACKQEGLEAASLRVLRASLNACTQQVNEDFYDPLQTTSIVMGLTAANEIAGKLKAQSINDAWRHFQDGGA